MLSKLPNTGTSIFTIMSKLSADNNAINLSQGFPDFNCSEELLKLVEVYQQKGFNQYAPMQGVKFLREEISKKICALYGADYDSETEITITAGATQAIYTAITTLIKKDDEVIIFEPAYDSYAPSVVINGGIPVYIPLTIPGYNIDYNKLEMAITPKTKLIIINSPHNPAGSIITENDIKELEKIVASSGIYIISDEVYEHITFDGRRHISIAESETLRSRSFVISSFGKTFHTTGWKIGYCTAPGELMNEFRKIHQFTVFAVNTPIQYAYAEFLKSPGNYLSLNKFYELKRDLFIKSLKGSAFKLIPSGGTYFQLLDYSDISTMNDMEFAQELIKENGIAVIPLSPFYSDKSVYNKKLIRICFAKRDEVLIKAGNILKEAGRKRSE